MEFITGIIIGCISGAFGIALGYVIRLAMTAGKKGSVDLEVKQILLDAKAEAQKITEAADKKAEQIHAEARKEEKAKTDAWQKTEDRFMKKEEVLEKKQREAEIELENIKKKAEEIKDLRTDIEKKKDEVTGELARVAGLSKEVATQELMEQIEKRHEGDLLSRVQKLERDGNDRLDRRAKEILTACVQRLASSTAGEIMVTNVLIPNEEIKGKIIGKEGRNIKTFERIAGVELIVDDTPNTIVISGFDPVRRQIARVALENLILDGRIQPAKIEEMVEKAKEDINRIIKDKGEQAAMECEVYNLDPRLIMILGRLYFRTSYGQNVLQHSTEMAHISGMLAQELGGDVAIAKAGALLHDIGKAVDHEVQGTHVEIGRRILAKFNVDNRIIQAMQSHHEEYPYETLESIIVQTADAISGGRPGARRDSVEQYIKKLEDLEHIATRQEGVEKAYALAAGREVRVFVTPTKVNDLEAHNIAREIALAVEKELKYPGEIKITVIRESRVIEFAR